MDLCFLESIFLTFPPHLLGRCKKRKNSFFLRIVFETKTFGDDPQNHKGIYFKKQKLIFMPQTEKLCSIFGNHSKKIIKLVKFWSFENGALSHSPNAATNSTSKHFTLLPFLSCVPLCFLRRFFGLFNIFFRGGPFFRKWQQAFFSPVLPHAMQSSTETGTSDRWPTSWECQFQQRNPDPSQQSIRSPKLFAAGEQS